MGNLMKRFIVVLLALSNEKYFSIFKRSIAMSLNIFHMNENMTHIVETESFLYV